MQNIYKITLIGIGIAAAIGFAAVKVMSANAAADEGTKTDPITVTGVENIGKTFVDIKNATLDDENETYTGEYYLSSDGTVTYPKWFEGDKLIKTDGDVYYRIQAETAPDYGAAEFDDYIIIGSAADEAENKFEAVRASDIMTREVDGETYTYRTLSSNGSMVLNLSCDPDTVNYLTVRLWGGDTGDTILWVCDPTTGCMDSTLSFQPHRNAGRSDARDWVELNYVTDTPQYDGGFIYATYEIPKIMTEGKTNVSIRLYSTGGPSNYGNVKIKEQTEPSRGIYAAFMTQDAEFNPESYGKCGGGKAENVTRADYSVDVIKGELKATILSGIDTLRNWQIYGGEGYPSYMNGMITRTNWRSDSHEDDDQWRAAYYNSSRMLKQNLTPMNMLELAAFCYEHYEDLELTEDEGAEMLGRVVAGVDFLCGAQGANGGFYSEKGWIGGPERVNSSSHHLEGFGLRYVAEAALTVCDDMDDDMRLQEIDADADGVADTPRIEAWCDMMSASRDYLTSLDGYGHAPNQDMANSIAALKFNAILAKADDTRVWDETQVKETLDVCFGKSVNPVTSSYWVSSKGTILENFGSVQGGYSGDYGSAAIAEMAQLARLAEEYYGMSDYNNFMSDVYSTIDNYYFTGTVSRDGTLVPCQYTEGLTSNRNAYYPGTERYTVDVYSALTLENDTALKIIDNYLRDKNISEESADGELSSSNAHYEDNILDVCALYENVDAIADACESRDIDEYDFVMDDDSVTSYVWSDETARSVVIKDGDKRIYMTLNWRNPLSTNGQYNTDEKSGEQKIKANNLARFHVTDDSCDRYGYAAVTTEKYSDTEWTAIAKDGETSCMEAVMTAKYGDYIIIMNSRGCGGGEGTEFLLKNKNLKSLGIEVDADTAYENIATGEIYRLSSGYLESGDKDSVAACSTLVLKRTAKTVTVTGSDTDRELTLYYTTKANDGTLDSVRTVRRTLPAGQTEVGVYAADGERVFIWDKEMKALSDIVTTE